jgi:hypothetical protein
MHEPFHEYLPESLCAWVEQRYYAQINAQARFEVLIGEQRFWEAPRAHVGMYSDHGVIHVRDVARQIVLLLDDIHGMLIPARPPERLDPFMKAYGVALAYLHDIGMVDFSPFGRSMHPEYAAQAVFTAPFDRWIEGLIAENVGGMAARLQSLARSGDLTQPPGIVLREMLALSMAHSKSKVPISVLNDRAILRATAQTSVGTDLALLYFRQQQAKGIVNSLPESAMEQRDLLSRYYDDFDRDAFHWLVAGGAEIDRLVDDIIDTLRALRAADALRQRGSVQKSSGGYEIFISQQTGGAVYALRLGGDKMYLLEINDRMSIGEANIASTELDRAGNLRISFHRGAFTSEPARMQAAAGAAFAVQDIQADVIESFQRTSEQDKDWAALGLKASSAIETWLESTDDSHGFVDMVCASLRDLNPTYAGQVLIVPSLQNVPDRERNRYLAVPDVQWSLNERRTLLTRMAESGCKVDSIDLDVAFRHVRLIRLGSGEILIEADEPASMVYVPLGDGLRIIPLGGYDSFSVQAWMPLGCTGVIRGALRNAKLIAEQAVSALMIPKDVYLRHWYATYTAAELQRRLGYMSPLETR